MPAVCRIIGGNAIMAFFHKKLTELKGEIEKVADNNDMAALDNAREIIRGHIDSEHDFESDFKVLIRQFHNYENHISRLNKMLELMEMNKEDKKTLKESADMAREELEKTLETTGVMKKILLRLRKEEKLELE